MKRLTILLVGVAALTSYRLLAETALATDQTNYNVGSSVMARFDLATVGTASIRYAGESRPFRPSVPLHGNAYQLLWKFDGLQRPVRTRSMSRLRREVFRRIFRALLCIVSLQR